MSVSSVSSSSTSSNLQQLMALMASSASSTESLFASSSDSNSDSVSFSITGMTLAARGSDPFKTDFDNLGDLISSGDLEAAQEAYAAMAEKMQSHGDDDPMASDFEAIGDALESGDLEAAQSAWSTMQTKLENFRGGMGAPGSNPLKADMDTLGDLLEP